MDVAAIILAAGKGTRMKSDLPKVAHTVCGRPMIEYVLESARAAGARRLLVVVGFRADVLRELLVGQPHIEFAMQEQQLGTGHAVMMCREQLLSHRGPVLVLAGDTPLLRPGSLQALLHEQQTHNAAAVIGTAVTENNAGLGRIVRNSDGAFERIVEERDATPEQKAITEINTGCYAFDAPALLSALDRLRPENDQAEYYLTDCPGILKADGRTVLAKAVFTIEEAMGVNTPQQLAEVEAVLKHRMARPRTVH
jgi:bifunctional UDP-N-acetylglucosamine pyrophosphorylase/glucosamine-1-phosphate N-acetyltransferase